MSTVEAFPLERSGPFDPPAALARLRRQGPVTRVAIGQDTAWLVTGWQEVRAALSDPRLSAAHTRAVSPAAPAPARRPEPRIPPGLFIAMDRPQHTRYRRAVAPMFSTAALTGLGHYIDRVVAEHVTAMLRVGPGVDFVAAFALPVPALVVGEVIGVPLADRAEFGHRSATLLTVNDTGVHDYLRELIARRVAAPGDDLISRLLADGQLPAGELATICALLLAAGHETVTSMLALGLLVLLDDPARYQALRAQPGRVGAVAEELLRYLSVVQFGVVRVARDDLVIAGQAVAAGDTVIASLAGANRDPGTFGVPDAFDPDREMPRHVAFGHGIHRCIGEHLARRQLAATLLALVDRLPTLHLVAPAAEALTSPGRAIYGVRELPVRW